MAMNKLTYRATFPTMSEAYAVLPADAEWSSSFGYPGQSPFDEYYRDVTGQRWHVARRGEYPEQWTVSAD